MTTLTAAARLVGSLALAILCAFAAWDMLRDDKRDDGSWWT